MVTFGQPNRLFAVSAPFFDVVETSDFMANRLSELKGDESAIGRYLRREGGDETVVVKALEVSDDGSGT